MVDDIFAREKLCPEALYTIKEIKTITKEGKIPKADSNRMLHLINNNNYTVFKNICLSALKYGKLSSVFDSSKTTQGDVTELLIRTNNDNRKLLEYYTALGCISDIILDEPVEFMENTLYDMNLERFSPSTIELMIEELKPDTAKTITMLVNQTDLGDTELLPFIYETRTFSETDISNLEENIQNGMAQYISDIYNDRSHPLRKELNTVDFRRCPYFLNNFETLLSRKQRAYEILKYPLKSTENINKTFRNLGSLMGKVYSNSMKEFDEYEARRDYYAFFCQNFQKTFGLISITDKETALHIFDKGFNNAANFIDMQKMLTKEDIEILSNIVKNGKRQNRNGEYVDISAKSKVYACNLVSINRRVLANTTGEVDIASAISEAPNGIVPDFEKIEQQLKTKVLNQFGFSDEEVANLNPKDIDWDIHNMYLLTLPRSKNTEMEIVVQEASKGNFEKFIYDDSNVYGQANLSTMQCFKQAELDYNLWEKGLPPKKFEVAGEELTISLWKHRPQDSIFNGTYTTCCTSLDGTNGDSMPKYLLSRVFNIMEVKDKNGDIIAQSRFFLANPKSPILLVDNIEVNNNFKKKLYCNMLKDKFIEGIFGYYREFASKLGSWDIPLYFSRDNNKLYNCDDLNYPRKWVYISNIIGELVSKDAYCNLITQSMLALPQKNVSVYEVTKPMTDNSLLRFLDDGIN